MSNPNAPFSADANNTNDRNCARCNALLPFIAMELPKGRECYKCSNTKNETLRLHRDLVATGREATEDEQCDLRIAFKIFPEYRKGFEGRVPAWVMEVSS